MKEEISKSTFVEALALYEKMHSLIWLIELAGSLLKSTDIFSLHSDDSENFSVYILQDALHFKPVIHNRVSKSWNNFQN